jgi:imidazolonepropionase
MTSLLVTGIGHLTTNTGEPVTDAVVSIEDGRVVFAGPAADGPDAAGAKVLDCDGRAVIPGLVDAHTHVVFAGDRSDEFRRRMAGESYASIAAAGGGILATVAATRQADEEELFDLTARRVRRMMEAGTTALEIKSGYGLDTETETTMLRVARRVGDKLGVAVRTTFLGAHAVPADTDRDTYLARVIDEMLPEVAGLADDCDVFVEDGAFGVDEAEAVLTAAQAHGMGVRVHAEQLGRTGGAALAARLGALSADHLDHASDDDAHALAEANVSAVLVPGASYMLRGPQAPARMLLDAGCNVAIATDCNPGTSFIESMSFVVSLAVVQMGLTVEEALRAATRGGALALGWEDRGALAPGSVGDLVILEAPDPAHIPYRPGTGLVWRTVRDGRLAGGGN